MKFSKLSQLALVSILGLVAATLLSGCVIVTIDYVFVADSAGNSAGSAGQIETYAADAHTGALRPANHKIPSGGSKPVGLAVSSDYLNLYVANQSNSSVVHFLINEDGSLTQKDTVTAPFTPTALTVSQNGKYLFVAGGSNPGQLAAYSLSSGAIGSLASTVNLTLSGFATDLIVPTAVTVLQNNNAVYVAAYDQSAYNPGGTVTSSANPGWIYGFAIGSSGGLTPTSGSPYQAGVKPVSLVDDPTNRFLYAADFASNDLIGYSVQTGSALNFLVDGPFKTGNEPSSLVIDPRGLYLYVSNSLQSTVSAFTIALPSGSPSTIIAATGTASNSTDSQPVSILVDPALGRYVYTANYLGNSISGFALNPNTGAISATQATPYPTGTNPVAIAAVPHGNHAVQSVAP